MVRSPGVERQVAAAVRRDNLEAWISIQGSFEYGLRQTDGGLERLPDGIHQVLRGQPRTERRPPRVNEHHGRQFIGFRPKRIETAVGDVDVIGPRGDLDALEASFPHQHLEPSGRALRMLQGDGAKAHEARGICGAQRRNGLVLAIGDELRKVRIRPGVVLRRRRTQRLYIDTHGVHVRAARIDIGQPRQQGRHHGGVDAPSLCSHRLCACRSLRDFLGVPRHQGLDRRDKHMAVHIDASPRQPRNAFADSHRGLNRPAAVQGRCGRAFGGCTHGDDSGRPECHEGPMQDRSLRQLFGGAAVALRAQ